MDSIAVQVNMQHEIEIRLVQRIKATMWLLPIDSNSLKKYDLALYTP